MQVAPNLIVLPTFPLQPPVARPHRASHPEAGISLNIHFKVNARDIDFAPRYLLALADLRF